MCNPFALCLTSEWKLIFKSHKHPPYISVCGGHSQGKSLKLPCCFVVYILQCQGDNREVFLASILYFLQGFEKYLQGPPSLLVLPHGKRNIQTTNSFWSTLSLCQSLNVKIHDRWKGKEQIIPMLFYGHFSYLQCMVKSSNVCSHHVILNNLYQEIADKIFLCTFNESTHWETLSFCVWSVNMLQNANWTKIW